MPVISLVSPKGGVGKTTATVTLACQLARSAPVTVIDADPNKPVEAWARLPGKPDNVRVVTGVTQENIIDLIDKASQETAFVLVDCEGTASTTVAYAIGSADLVIVPTQGSQLDAKQAGRALALVRDGERMGRRKIPLRVLFTRSSSAIRTRNLDNVQGQLRSAGVAMFDTHLHEREAFRAVFSVGGTLEALKPTDVTGAEKAVVNARRLMEEVIAVLRSEGEAA